MIGRLGSDRLLGGSGNDDFVFRGLGDSTVGAGADLITDFVRGADDIDLSALDANALTGPNNAFNFIGTGAFTGVAGQLRFQQDAASNRTQVFGDVNADGVADFQINLQGLYNLAATDFVF